MSAFSEMWDALFADDNIATDAEYTPAAGAASTVRVILRQPDAQLELLGGGVVTASTALVVRVSQVADPKVGETFEVGGVVYTINAAPKRDAKRLVWAIEAPTG